MSNAELEDRAHNSQRNIDCASRKECHSPEVFLWSSSSTSALGCERLIDFLSEETNDVKAAHKIREKLDEDQLR
jgi:hypothetical protein